MKTLLFVVSKKGVVDNGTISTLEVKLDQESWHSYFCIYFLMSVREQNDEPEMLRTSREHCCKLYCLQKKKIIGLESNFI